MSDVKWAPDGKKMFEKLLSAVPEAMRDMVNPQLLKLLAAKASGKPVTAHVVTRMVQEDLPEPQKGMIMQSLGIKKPAENKSAKGKAPAPAAADTAQIKGQEVWEGSSRSMFEQMIKEVPESLRDVFRGKLMDILRQKAKGGPYRESYVTEIVNEIVPEPWLRRLRGAGWRPDARSNGERYPRYSERRYSGSFVPWLPGSRM